MTLCHTLKNLKVEALLEVLSAEKETYKGW